MKIVFFIDLFFKYLKKWTGYLQQNWEDTKITSQTIILSILSIYIFWWITIFTFNCEIKLNNINNNNDKVIKAWLQFWNPSMKSDPVYAWLEEYWEFRVGGYGKRPRFSINSRHSLGQFSVTCFSFTVLGVYIFSHRILYSLVLLHIL